MNYYEYETDFSLTSKGRKGGGGSGARKGNTVSSSRKQKQEQKLRNQQTASVYSSKHVRMSLLKNSRPTNTKTVKQNKSDGKKSYSKK